jgi:chemotaxis protein MotB
MFATSQTDKGKTVQLQESMRNALDHDKVVSRIAGILGGTPNQHALGSSQWKGPGGVEKLAAGEAAKFTELLAAKQLLDQQLEQEIAQGAMQVSMNSRGLIVSFQQATFFPSGDDQISDEHFNIVLKVAEVIRALPNPIRFEGHTDALPVRGNGRFASNWDLSAARAIAMMEALATCCDLDSSRFSVAGYADKAPIADNSSDAGRQRNRRVDIVILNSTGASQEPARP